MFAQTRNVARKYVAKGAAGAGGLIGTGLAMAQTTSPSETVLAAVNDGFTGAQSIAVAVVVGLFAIFAIKLLWRAK